MIVGMRMKGWFERRYEMVWQVVCWLRGSVVYVLVCVFWASFGGSAWVNGGAYIECDGGSLVGPW